MVRRLNVVPTKSGFLTEECHDGALVAYTDYARLEEALRSLLKELKGTMGSPCDDCDCELCAAVRSAVSVLTALGGCGADA